MEKWRYILSIHAIIIYGCTKPYGPPSTTTNYGFLVVEGMINTGNDSTKIVLSRTVTIANNNTTAVETKATVTVENAQGTSYAVPETSVKGTYAAASLNLSNTQQYRLRIKTSNGSNYLSAFVTPKVAPPIDSVGFTIQSNGIQVYVNTHDASNNTRYYKYTFGETWIFRSFYYSDYISNGTTMVSRTAANQVFTCFTGDTSANTIINSTAALAQDVVYQFPISTIAATSEKLEAKYSILVTQQALTVDAYNFWQNLQKNTEDLGSIFDAQPSQLVRNIANIANAAEPVIGYISAGTLQRKRIFIERAALPLTPNWNVLYPYSCPLLDSAYYSRPIDHVNYVQELLINLPPKAIAIEPFSVPNIGAGFLYTNYQCGDCTVRGSVKQPAFWK